MIQAPMAGVVTSKMVISACKAGALGSLPCAMLSAQVFEKEVRAIREAIGNDEYNLNFFASEANTAYNERAVSEWKRYLKEEKGFDRELGIDLNSNTSLSSSSNVKREEGVSFEDAMKILVSIGAKPAVISFHFGLPRRELVEKAKKLFNCKIISSATTVEEAIYLEKNGADAVIAQGYEAGGHRGVFLNNNVTTNHPWHDVNTQLGTFALLPQIVKAVKIPVIAAGGICDHSTIKAALALGATSVQIGTTFLCCNESLASPLYKHALKAQEEYPQTVVTNVFSITGRPARVIVNRFVRETGCGMNEMAPSFPHAAVGSLPLKIAAEAKGIGEFSSFYSGQNRTGIREGSIYDLILDLKSSLILKL